MNQAEEEELISIVDENNAVVGKAKRLEVYQKGLLHRAVNVIVKNSKGQIYIQQRAKSKSSFPLCWDISCAEHLKPNESFEQGAKRGVREELGISVAVKLIRPLHKQYSEFEKNGLIVKENELVELYEAVWGNGISIDEEEVAQGKFLPKSKIAKMLKDQDTLFTPWFLDEWKFLSKED